MGRKLDALLGRNFRASKFKALSTVAISRIVILKRQRFSRFSQAKSDVIELLNLDQHDRALIRVELVVKDRLMLDAFDMIRSYCELLKESVLLLQKTKECPDELKESISSLIFASSRCAEFPELQEMRAVFQVRFGKEFVARAIELRNNCAVNPKIIQKLSARQPSLESRIEVLRSIASEVNIILDLKLHVQPQKPDVSRKQEPEESDAWLEDSAHKAEAAQSQSSDSDEEFSESLKAKNKYRDAAAAAKEAFQSAAYAAMAARAALKLSRSESNHGGSGHHGGTMDNQIIVYEAYPEEEEESHQLQRDTPAEPDQQKWEHKHIGDGFAATDVNTLNWNQLTVSSGGK